MFADCSEDHIKSINILCGQKTQNCLLFMQVVV